MYIGNFRYIPFFLQLIHSTNSSCLRRPLPRAGLGSCSPAQPRTADVDSRGITLACPGTQLSRRKPLDVRWWQPSMFTKYTISGKRAFVEASGFHDARSEAHGPFFWTVVEILNGQCLNMDVRWKVQITWAPWIMIYRFHYPIVFILHPKKLTSFEDGFVYTE